MRAFLTQSRAGRTLCVLLLAVFLVLCAMHAAGAHHDEAAESVGLVAELLLAATAAVLLLGLLRTRNSKTDPGRSDSATEPGPSKRHLPHRRLALGVPLRC
jgi:hypothetical protein